MNIFLALPGSEERRDLIEAALKQAAQAGGDPDDLEHNFVLINTALAGLLIVLPSGLHEVFMVGFIRGFSPPQDAAQERHHTHAARLMLGLSKSQAPAGDLLCVELYKYLDGFLELRMREPEVAKYFFKALRCLCGSTATMSGNID